MLIKYYANFIIFEAGKLVSNPAYAVEIEVKDFLEYGIRYDPSASPETNAGFVLQAKRANFSGITETLCYLEFGYTNEFTTSTIFFLLVSPRLVKIVIICPFLSSRIIGCELSLCLRPGLGRNATSKPANDNSEKSESGLLGIVADFISLRL